MGVVDIGSNSVRLVVYEGAVRAPTPIFNEKVVAGLGRSIASTGKLDEVAIDSALAGLVRFRAILGILAELRKVAVRPEDKALSLEAPSVMDDARFVLVATFSRGAGQDSVIKPILVRPR